GEKLTESTSTPLQHCWAGRVFAQIKGLAISNSDVIRGVHNQFARSDPFVNEIVDSSAEKEDAFHFISYVPANGSLYELDGLAPAPAQYAKRRTIPGECTQDDWVSKVRPVIQERMARYTAAGEIRFNLMAVIKSRAEVYGARLEERENALERNPSNEAVKYECEALRQRIRVEQEKQERYRVRLFRATEPRTTCSRPLFARKG
ncbi:MAG: hypothetical protein BJ554DRAFT_6751, partial [Olpidium bornovanus]